MTSPIKKTPATQGSFGNHTIDVKIGGPAVEGFTREVFMRDLKKATRRVDEPKKK